MRDVLDGFPVKPLIDHYLGAIATNPADAKRDAAHLDCTITSWIKSLSTAIRDYASFADDETLSRLAGQLKNAQEALIVLRAELAHIEHLRSDALQLLVHSRNPMRLPRKSSQQAVSSPARRTRRIGGSRQKMPNQIAD